MTRLFLLTAPFLLAACADRGAQAVQDYPAQYLCRLEGGFERVDNKAEMKAVRDEIVRRGIECYRGTVKTDSDLF